MPMDLAPAARARRWTSRNCSGLSVITIWCSRIQPGTCRLLRSPLQGLQQLENSLARTAKLLRQPGYILTIFDPTSLHLFHELANQFRRRIVLQPVGPFLQAFGHLG